MPDVLNRDYIREQVLIVLADWGVVPAGRGSGVGDVEYWCDVIQDLPQERPPQNRGWEPYWIGRIGDECKKAGYTQGHTPPPPPPPPNKPPDDPPSVDLGAYLADLSKAINEIRAQVNALAARKAPNYVTEGDVPGYGHVKVVLKPQG